MSGTPEICRRAAEGPIRVRFSVNDGPRHSSDTTKINKKFLAVKSDVKVCKGDFFSACMVCPHLLKGEVVRVMENGFAVSLDDIAPETKTQFRRPQSETADNRFPPGRKDQSGRTTSFVFPLESASPSWARLVSTFSGQGRGHRHRLSIMITAPIDVDTIRGVWITVGETEWVARIAGAGRREAVAILSIFLNGWQIHKAAKHGISILASFESGDDWNASCDGEPFESHLAAFAPEIDMLSA